MKQMTQVQSIPVLFIYLVILYYTVKLELRCSSCNFSERNNLASADVICCYKPRSSQSIKIDSNQVIFID